MAQRPSPAQGRRRGLLLCTLCAAAAAALVPAEQRPSPPHGAPPPASAQILVPDWTAEPDRDGAELGVEIGTGDFNGDGRIDVVVGSYLYSNPEKDEGAALVYLGTSAGFPGHPDWVFEGNREGLHLGRAVAGAGDVNGDGFDDIIVGAPTFSNDPADGTTAGAYVFHGSPAGPSRVPDWEYLSHQHGDRFGRAVGPAGDVNGDGYGDVVIGAYFYDGEFTDEGEASVFYGSPRGLSAEPDWEASGDQEEAGFAWGVGAAGDVNGDGYADLIVGAPQYDRGRGAAGRAFLYLGSSAGLSSAPAWVADSPDVGANFGRSVHGAGDVNGDGYADVIVGARRLDRGPGGGKQGAAFVYHGSPAGLLPEPGWVAVAREPESIFGHAVHSAGDVNGDGFDDVAVGQPGSDLSADGGRVRIYLGGRAGLSGAPAWTLEAGQAGAWFGTWVQPAGDVDRDGLDDLLVGAWRYDGGQHNEGRVFLYGGATLLGHRLPPVAHVRGDHDGDGYADILFQQEATGQTALFSMNGARVVEAGLVGSAGPDWRVDGRGDYDGDGRADLLLRHGGTGRVDLWRLDGTVVVSRATVMTVPDPIWEIVGSGDLDGDGRDDVVWRNRANGATGVHLMDGHLVRAGRRIAGASGAEWRLVGVGDFDGDGKADVLWQEPVAGGAHVALMDGARVVTEAPLPPTGSTRRLEGVADVDGEGRADAVWRDVATGVVGTLLMDGSRVAGTADLGVLADAGSSLVSVADFDGNGQADLLWSGDGTLRLWLLDGLRVGSEAVIAGPPGPGWRPVGSGAAPPGQSISSEEMTTSSM